MSRVRIRFQFAFDRQGWLVWAFRRDQRGRRVPLKITIAEGEPIDEGQAAEPAAAVQEEEFRDFIGALKDGLAESGLLQSTGALELELKATRAHLEDMRALTFKTGKPG